MVWVVSPKAVTYTVILVVGQQTQHLRAIEVKDRHDALAISQSLASGEHSNQLHRTDDAGNADDRHAAYGTVAYLVSE